MEEVASFRPVQAVRAYEAIVDQVEEALVRGTLRPGHRLPSERNLMTQFGVSRSTVREALRVLESDGLIRSRPGDPRGAEVLPYSPGGLRKSVLRLARVDELSLGELLQFRMILEGAVNRIAAQRCTPEHVAAMEAAIAAMKAAIEIGHPEFSEADIAFHDVVAAASGNMMAQVCGEVTHHVVLALIDDKLARADDQAAQMRQSLEHHEQVLAAIRSGDGAGASRLALRKMFEYYASYLPEDERPMLEILLDPALPAVTGRTS